MFGYLKQRKKLFPVLTIIMAAGLFLVLAHPANADVSEVALTVFGYVVWLMVSITGQLLLVVISVLITVAQFNNFIYVAPVAQGWTIVRDLCNMFFVLVLLVIAFATILHLPNYSIKKLLPRVIIFAILINFSKMICGLVIDFAQVIMLTFVNAFKDIGGGNMAALLGIDKLLSAAKNLSSAPGGMSFWNVAGSLALALIYSTVMLVTMVALLATLVYRIVMLWIYVILSPLAYLAAIVPAEKGVYKNWWSQFIKQATTGPLLAFFIWLSLATLGQGPADNNQWAKQIGFNAPDTNVSVNQPQAGVGDIGTTGQLMRFVISLGLLIGGLIVSKQFGGLAGAAISQVVGRAQKGAGWLKRKGKVAAKRAGAYAGRKTWQGAKAAGRGGLGLAKTADYAISKRIAERERTFKTHEGEEFKMRVPYGYEQGFLTRKAGQIKESAFTKAGRRKHFENAVRTATGIETNADFNRRHAAAKATGKYTDYTGREYKYDEDLDRYVDEDGRYAAHPITGEEIKAKGDASTKLYQFLAGSKFRVAKDSEALTKEKTALSDLAKPYANYSKDELKTLMAGTVNPQQLQGIGYALAEKDGLDNKADTEKIAGLIQDKPERLKAFVDAVAKKSPELVYDPDSVADQKALALKAKKGEINLSEMKFKSFKLDDNGQLSLADKETGSKLLKIVKDVLGPLRSLAQLDKLKKEGDMEAVSKVAQFSGLAAQQAFNRSANLERYSGQTTDPAEAAKLKDASRVNQNEAFSWYKDQLNMGKGDIREFGKVGDKAPDAAMLKKLFAEGSVKDLSAIDAGTFNQSLEAQTAAMSMTFKKLDGLYKSNNNPELTRAIAEVMVKGNHKDTQKIRDIYSDI
jgi:hypothetical protein